VKRLTIRARLTLVYGGLVLLAGVLLLGATSMLVDSQLLTSGTVVVQTGDQPSSGVVTGGSTAGPSLRVNNGDVIAPDQLSGYLRRSALRTMFTQGGLALLAVTAAAVASAWLLAGRALQPLHRITDTARRIARAETGRGLHERIALSGPSDEVKELADTFDVMVERLDRAFDGQRRFVANASHELRTPLAINRALVEVAVTRPGISADVRQLGDGLLLVNARHERLIDGLLTLADSEYEVSERTAVDLAEIVRHVLDSSAGAATRAGVTIQPPVSQPAPTSGDPVLLERLVSNLVENAIRHNAPEGRVSIRTGQNDGLATVTVTNTGPIIPAYEVETLFQPFRRLSQERSSGPDRGFGLGLSIVRAVARAHGGAVHARPRDGGGLIVEARLPGPG
jgi:signal transduction histidine kinase